MFKVVARIEQEIYDVEYFSDKDKAFDFVYLSKKSFQEKGGWILEVECSKTGQLVEDDRLID